MGQARSAAARHTPAFGSFTRPRAGVPPSPSTSRALARWTVFTVALLVVVAALSPGVFEPARADDGFRAVTVASCPYGWSLYSPPMPINTTDSAAEAHLCARVFIRTPVPDSAAESLCTSLFSSGSDAPLSRDGVTPWPYATYASPHGVAVHSAAENAFFRSLFSDAYNAGAEDDGVVVLGGAAGYGVVHWYADASSSGGNALHQRQKMRTRAELQEIRSPSWLNSSRAAHTRGGLPQQLAQTTAVEAASAAAASTGSAAYTNFAADVDWQRHSGLIAMRASGQWTLLTSAASAHAFACAFKADFTVIPPATSPTSRGSGNARGTSSSSGNSDSNSEGESNSGFPQRGGSHAKRPAAPQPAPPCLSGWTALPASVDTSDGAANTVCYRLFANASEVGGRLGKNFEGAREHCAAVNPKGSLASIMSQQENTWVVSTLLSAMAAPPTPCTCDGSSMAEAPAHAASVVAMNGVTHSARTVFLGGSFMHDSSGAGLIGSWYADQYLFNASEYAAASPSSPAWPTSTNLYYSNWSEGEPALSYGVVGITPPPPTECDCGNASTSSTSPVSAAGMWVGLDPRSTQPFLCSYLNDGSVFPSVPPTPMPNPSSTTSPTPSPSEHCLSGWSHLALTNSCYRVFPSASTETEGGSAVTAATMEEHCEQVLRGQVVVSKIGRVRAVAMQSIAESDYVGSLLSLYLKDTRNTVVVPEGGSSGSIDSTSSPLPVSLAGVSFIDHGAGGFYLSGVRELDPLLADRLWAAGEPANVKGCVAVDAGGLWYYIPCSSSSASMPANEAVRVLAYTCQYRASDIDPKQDLIPEATTQPPIPTSNPDWSSDSDSSSPWLPLGQRVQALSGAVHVVAAAGSTGIYALQGPNATIPPVASVHGLHFFFAPLSAYYTYPAPRRAVDGTVIVPPVQTTPGMSVDDLLSIAITGESSPVAPCAGHKEQSRIARVRANVITVQHTNHSEVGYVCVSQDGRNYVPTAITYEVTEVTVDGFINTPSRSPAANSTAAWLPPLFCGTAIEVATTTPSAAASACALQRDVAIAEHATGTVQLVLRRSGGASAAGTVTTVLSPEVDTVVSHVRLSSSADCMGEQVPFQLLDSEIEVRHVSSERYTQSSSPLRAASGRVRGNASLQYSVFSYQHASVHAARLASLDPVYNSSEVSSVLAQFQHPAEYYVCVSVHKPPSTLTSDVAEIGAASRRLLALWGASVNPGISSSSSSSSGASTTFSLSIAERLAARTSVSPAGAAVRTYTAVPGLKAHLVPPPVSIKGMWALPPRRLRQQRAWSAGASGSTTAAGAPWATLVPAAATHNRSAHYLLRTQHPFDSTDPMSASSSSTALPSTVHLHIPQHSSPIILLDGHHAERGMLALLSQKPNDCNRHQPLPLDDPTRAAATWPRHLDTMVPLSTVTMTVEGSGTAAATATVAYMQLNLNHTGLWGHHPTRTDDPAATQQTWYVCISYGALSPFLPVRQPALRITVHRQRVDRFLIDSSVSFTRSEAVAAAEAADASTTHLNVNAGFAGMLWLHGLDVRLWSTTTLHSAQVAFSVVLPSSGTADDTAAQCANANLFYAQRALGLLTPESCQHTRAAGVNSSADDDAACEDSEAVRAGMVVPLGFFTQHSLRRMQLCLSVPLPFATNTTGGSSELVPQRRFFAPLVNTTLDVRPIQLLYMGRYSSIPASAAAVPPNPAAPPSTGATLIRLAEGARDVVLPLTGYGIRPDMTMFLSSQLCHGVPISSIGRHDNLVKEQSALNISVVSLYDLPSSYWAPMGADNDAQGDGGSESGSTHQPRVFVVLKHSDLLSSSAAQRLFGASTAAADGARKPLNVCLYAPGTATLVFPTNFQLVVEPPRVTAIRNLPSDAPLLARATAHMPPYNNNSSSSSSSSPLPPSSVATVVYAGIMDLIVEGFGLEGTNTWLTPAVDCGNASSHLWRTPVQLSALPSSTTTTMRIAVENGSVTSPLYAESTRYVDPQTSFSSWFISLRQAETARVGADANISSGTYVDRFQWCVRIGEANEDEAVSPYVSTGLPYRLVIPATDGFVLEDSPKHQNHITTVLPLPMQHATGGRWFAMKLAGPIVDVVQAIGSPLYMFLAPKDLPCYALKNSYIHQGLHSFGSASFSAVNGSAVLLPRWLTVPGIYQLCASTLYPTLDSADEGIEAALQFFSLHGLQVQLTNAVYSVSALNHTTSVTVEQGQEWALPISGSLLTNRSLVRFHASASQCSQPMVATTSSGGAELPDIRVQDAFTGFSLFGDEDDNRDSEDSFPASVHYIVLPQSLIRSLAAPATYVLCFQPQNHLDWRVAPAISLIVKTHVRRPTAYSYFPADGSEDVVLLTALPPSKVALEWNTGEENMVNVVGTAGRQVSLALWCLPAPTRSNNSGVGVEEDLVPCGDHRRVMFVKPMDNDEDPCFVDAEAVPEDVVRGPYVLHTGVLTMPYVPSTRGSGNGDDAVPVIIPNITQPWIMCLETGPERWREPVHPMFQLQYTHAMPTGFRVKADDASNTTAPFPAHKVGVAATTSAEVDRGTGMRAGGNTTLILYAQDSSQVVYLNGYGIERGHRLRFGARCEETMEPPASSRSRGGVSSGGGAGMVNSTLSDMADYHHRVAARQLLANTRLYTDPLPIEDDNGVFLVPSTHILLSEEATSGAGGIAACVSTDGGATYAKTSLTLRVLPSRLRIDTETTQRNLLAQILTDTLLVPENSYGSVDLTALIKAGRAIGSSTEAAMASPSSVGGSGMRDADMYLPPGTQVLLSTNCSYNSHGIPLLTVSVSNVLTLAKHHTGTVTPQRLRVCVRNPEAAVAAAAVLGSGVSEDDGGTTTAFFVASGVYYRVISVQVSRVSLHAWTPTEAMQADLIEQVVLRRSAREDLLLPVLLKSTARAETTVTVASSPEDELLQRLELSPSALSLLSLTRFYVGQPCYRSAQSPDPASAISPYVSSYGGMQLNFGADRITVSPLPGQGQQQLSSLSPPDSLSKTLVAALPSGNTYSVPHYTLESRGSVCFSVDGGLHYLFVGIAHFTEEWAPTLRVTLNAEEDEKGKDVREEADATTTATPSTNAMRVYTQSSTTRQLLDTRYVDPGTLPPWTAAANHTEAHVLADLGQLTTAMLWTGFLGDNAFAVNGLLYLLASSHAAPFAETSPSGLILGGGPQPQPLLFSLDNRLQNISTNMTVTVVPWSLTCYGDAQQRELYVHPPDVGLLAATTPGRCSAGMRDGVRVRVVPLSMAACNDTIAVDTLYLFDLSTVQPAVWGATAAAGEAASSPARAMQLPIGLRYTPEGLYALCLRQDLPYVSSLLSDNNARAPGNLVPATYAATPLRLRVSRNWTVVSVSSATVSNSSDNVVAIAQSSHAELPVTGTAVRVRGTPVLFAFAPPSAQTVTRRGGSGLWTWSGGCAAVPEAWDPVTGMPLVSASASSASGPDGLLLTAPWRNAQSGVLRVDAAYVSRVEWDTAAVVPAAATNGNSTTASARYAGRLRSYALCYSVDGGLSFQAAGTAGQTSPRTLAAVVVPPTITSLSCNRTTAADPAQRLLGWSADNATATTVRVQYLYSSPGADASITSSPQVVTYAARPPTYTYAWTSAFVGNGMGAASGRRLPTVTTTAADVPTVAAAVALVRTSRYGARCDGAAAVSANFTQFYGTTVFGADAWNVSAVNTSSPLAMPIFLINLQHGGVWSTADTAAVVAWRGAQTAKGVAEFERMNPVLSQETWVNQTAALWARYKDVPGAPLNGQSILGWATDAATAASRSNGESIVVCLSIDGAHFYSADVARAAALAPKAQAQQQVVIATASASSSSTTTTVTHLSPWPLYLRSIVGPSISNASANTTMASVTTQLLWMREISMVMELLARPTTNAATATAAAASGSPYLGCTSASLALFQEAMAAALGIDPSVVVVQLHMSGLVALPKAAASLHAVESVAVAAVQARHRAAGTLGGLQRASTALTDKATADPQPVLLPTYALVLSIIADAVAYNAAVNTSTLSAAPDLLYRGVQLLRDNASGPALLATLARGRDAVATASLSSLTVNFTLRNGVDLHAANATMSAALPWSPPQEVAWRRLFLSIPHATLSPGPVPDDKDNDTTSKLRWWAIPLLLVLPGIMVYGTYYVYKKYLQPANEATKAPVVEEHQ
ncbi:conserved hypothetical protein [Leishmania major strain Friedlin]|uniref:C-type lectin domain-containing protein n=1 Tax=Leishmania major TaxID=5664 RepID=O97218_LEIMA|nr:conserved hypothetical protein [Leishmania major strain Friedlin]CAC22694.1 conserved hypothetical protein [Leishmania major strain Friedlin]CAG9567702.1 hypothetical_protein_-_conserved [Leishmania major strain Friedlin]|eukprot:XP_888570.1 conserved hypothetical protein [Leishmania major strain Friedlin]